MGPETPRPAGRRGVRHRRDQPGPGHADRTAGQTPPAGGRRRGDRPAGGGAAAAAGTQRSRLRLRQPDLGRPGQRPQDRDPAGAAAEIPRRRAAGGRRPGPAGAGHGRGRLCGGLPAGHGGAGPQRGAVRQAGRRGPGCRAGPVRRRHRQPSAGPGAPPCPGPQTQSGGHHLPPRARAPAAARLSGRPAPRRSPPRLGAPPPGAPGPAAAGPLGGRPAHRGHRL